VAVEDLRVGDRVSRKMGGANRSCGLGRREVKLRTASEAGDSVAGAVTPGAFGVDLPTRFCG